MIQNYEVVNVTNVRTSNVGGNDGLKARPSPAKLGLREQRIGTRTSQISWPQHITNSTFMGEVLDNIGYQAAEMAPRDTAFPR